MELKEKFWAMDTSGDNKLNFAEMRNLLLEGNPDFTDKELKALFIAIDTNNNGTVDFDEFVEFLFGVPRAYVVSPGPVQQKFEEYCGKDMDCIEFHKLCVDCGVTGRNFKKEEIAATFARVVPRGKRKITLKPGPDGFSQWDKLLCLVAEKRNCNVEFIHELITNGTITSSGTVADDVRLHDDKSTYTGGQAYGQKAPSGALAKPVLADDYDVGPPGDWEPVRVSYRAFQSRGGLSNREFVKLCEDCQIIDDERFLKGDADVIFAKLKRQKLDWDSFQEAVTAVAMKKRQQLEDIMSQIAECEGPITRCTLPDEVRLHDDKSCYTGVHAG